MGGPGHPSRRTTLVERKSRWNKDRDPQRQPVRTLGSGKSILRVKVSPNYTLRTLPGKANKWPDALSRLHAPTKSSIPIELLTIERTPVVTRDQSFWRSIGKAYMCNHGWWGSRLPSTYVRSGCIAPAASSAPGPGPSPSKVGDVRRFHLQTKRASVFAFV
jgi:hypothetical protein